jgi:hypothetical protein
VRHLYHTRVEVQRLSLQMKNNVPQQVWEKIDDIVDPYLQVPGEMMCRIDLVYQRPGKDLPLPITAGRAPDRVGVLYFDPTDQIRAGDRILCIDGPIAGTFDIRVMPDPAAGYSAAHHMEVQIIESVQSMQPNLLTKVES